MMNPKERKALDTAMKAVHSYHKWVLSIDAAVDNFESGRPDTKENSKRISEYSEQAQEYAEEAIELYDELMQTAG